jgi:hypothetical protein
MEVRMKMLSRRLNALNALFYALICLLFTRSYESANGIKAEETGDVKNKGSENAIQTVQGSYSYTSPEGDLIQVYFIAHIFDLGR